MVGRPVPLASFFRFRTRPFLHYITLHYSLAATVRSTALAPKRFLSLFRDSKSTRAKLGPARSRAHPSTSAAAPPHRRAVFRRFGGYAGDLITPREWRMVALALMSFYSATSLRHAAPTAGKPTWRLWRHARARSACAARLGKLIDAGRDVRALGAGR